MDKMLRSHPASAGPSPMRDPARRSARGVRSHPLVACLAGGLQATYAAQPDDAIPEHFADLIARLDRAGPGVS